MSEFKPVIYRSFVESFDRGIKPGVRTFVAASDEMAAFAEARYFGWGWLEANRLMLRRFRPRCRLRAGHCSPSHSGQSELVKEVIAKEIIARAMMGERDPNRLRASVLASFGLPTKDTY